MHRETSPVKNPGTAAVLSFVITGLGQIDNGQSHCCRRVATSRADGGGRKEKRRVNVLLGVGCFALLLAGCVSGSGEFQWRYHAQHTLSQKNRQALMNLRSGMSPSEVRAVMGEPQMVEGYPRETVWYYRTAATGLESSTVLDTTATQRSVREQDLSGRSGRGTDANFTPLVFDDRQRLVAWGREILLPDRLSSETPVQSLP